MTQKTTTASTPASNGSAAARLTHVDRPEVAETFVDSLGRISCDNAPARMEFVIRRLHEPIRPRRRPAKH